MDKQKQTKKIKPEKPLKSLEDDKVKTSKKPQKTREKKVGGEEKKENKEIKKIKKEKKTRVTKKKDVPAKFCLLNKLKFDQLNKIQFKKIKLDWVVIIVILLAAAFFVASSLFNYYGQQGGFVKWSSPDETANYNVSKLYAQTNSLMYFEEHNPEVDELMHPRSYRSDYGFVKPVSFLGMPILYGKIGRIFGIEVIPYLTPLFAAFSIIFFFLLIRRIFDQPIALISTFLLAGFPVYIYYSSRSMFHNVPFMAFLIIGLYFGAVMVQNANKIKSAKKKGEELTMRLATRNWSLLQACLSGLFIGIAATMRTSEILWLGPLLFFLWVLNFTRIGLPKLLLFLSFFAIAFLPVLYWNNILYGGPFHSGYPQLNESVVSITSNSTEIVKTTIQQDFHKVPTLAEKLRDSFFFFGFKARHALKMFYHYFYSMFDWLFWLSIAGGLLFLPYFKFQKRRHWIYIFGYLVIFPILLLYYGSWVFYDNPDPNSFTIGNSYTRYWLPLYFGVLPFVALLITKLTQWIFRSKYLYNPIRAGIVLGLLLWSAWFVAFGSEEGLVPSLQRHLEARQQYQAVIKATENNAVIITTYHDKLFFPERRIIVAPITDKELNKRFEIAAKYFPIYYYNFTFPEKDLYYLNDRLLRENNLGIRKIKKINKDFTLYKIELRQ